MNKFFRRLGRIMLKYLSISVLYKHKPLIIVTLGEGPTSLAREFIYSVVSLKYPTRRNLETPEAEFSIPLTIIDFPNYPKDLWQWMWVIIKTSIQFFTVPRYKHALVLELTALNQEILDYWLTICQPKYVLVVGVEKLNIQTNAQIITVTEDEDDILGSLYDAVDTLASELDIPLANVSTKLSNLNLPQSRIRFLQSKTGATVIDATHYYFPTDLQAVLEVAASIPAPRKFIFTNSESDLETLKTDSHPWIINPDLQNVRLTADDLLILRGNRVQVLPKFNFVVNQTFA